MSDDSWYFQTRDTNPKMDVTETVEEKAKRLGLPIIPAKLPKMFSKREAIGICGHCSKEIYLDSAPCRTPVCPVNR